MKPNDMNGMPIMRLIPSLFLQVHAKRCSEFFNGVKSDVPFEFFNSSTRLPFVIHKNQIKMFELSLVFTYHIRYGFSILCILRENLEERNYNFLSLY